MDICLLKIGIMHTIVKGKRFFSNLVYDAYNVSAITWSVYIIEGHRVARLILLDDTQIHIKMYSMQSVHMETY